MDQKQITRGWTTLWKFSPVLIFHSKIKRKQKTKKVTDTGGIARWRGTQQKNEQFLVFESSCWKTFGPL